jgi:phosphoribosyl-dephospho-CoA transferase
MRRHDLIFVRPAAWRSLVSARRDLAGNPLVAGWVDKSWPLMRRRAVPGEGSGIPLGLPLPPFAGKQRLSVLIEPEDIVSTEPPPTLCSARRAAPPEWWPTLDRLDALAAQHGVEARVFGSLAWSALTGLNYLTINSDLDLLLQVHRGADLHALASGLARIEADAPMRLDGELIRRDGAAVNWREFHARARQILVKAIAGVAVIDASLFLPEGMPS